MNTTNIKQKFRNAIQRGTGEAYLLIKNNPDIDFSKDIIKASLHNYAYDGQSENSRAFYLFEIIKLSQNQDKIRNSIHKALLTEKQDTWTLTQLFDLARLYALQGDKKMHKAIYKRFHTNISNGSSWVGSDEIIELDGLNGLLFIANKIGKYLLKHPDDWEDDLYIQQFHQVYPDIDVYDELEKAANKNTNIRLYIDNVKETSTYRAGVKSEQKTYNSIIEEIEQQADFFIKNRIITEEEITQIADKFLSEKDKQEKAKYLSVFCWVKYPYDYKSLLLIAKGNNDKYRIKEYAIESLKHIQADEIREFALNKIEMTTQPAIYTDLLQSNYSEGDELLLTNIANKFKNEYIIESIACSYIDIYTKNKTKSCKRPLEALYNKMNCGIHRNAIIEILIENDVLSNTLREEIQFDSDEDTRMLAKNLN